VFDLRRSCGAEPDAQLTTVHHPPSAELAATPPSRYSPSPLIKYIGSKRLLVPWIVDEIRALPDVAVVAELFSGTARVGRALKAAGYRVIANDHNAYAATLARCYVEADPDEVETPAQALLDELATLPPRAGWFTKEYAETARYLHPDNAARIEAIREAISARALPATLEAVVLTALLEAADRVDSTVGVQMAYLKQWAPRALRPLELRLPTFDRPVVTAHTSPTEPTIRPRCEVWQLDALDAAAKVEADVAYLDPPYNQHSYLSNYHVWETLVRWDEPETYGVARKRVDCRERKSPFNRRNTCLPALDEVIAALRVRTVLVSFSADGFVSPDSMLAMLRRHGEVEVRERTHPRYVGAKIGIYNPSGEKVGIPGPSHVVERLFVLHKPNLR
jgi:adenine-specific DNA-methyltransferase